MALRTFETNTARYYLGLGNHATSSAPIFEDVDVKSLDFLVLEGGALNTPEQFQYNRQYYDLYQRLKEETTVYDVDFGPSKSMLRFSWFIETGLPYVSTIIILEPLIGPFSVPVGLASIIYPTPNNQNTPITFSSLSLLNGLHRSLIPTPMGGFRDAVAAKKISEYLVPKHQHQDGSKVQVGILYGAMHSGIETKIKHPWISNATIKLYHDFFRYGNTAALNEVREIVPGQEEFVKYDCGLFK